MKNVQKLCRQYRWVFSIAYRNYTTYIKDIIGINVVYVIRLLVIIFFYKAIYLAKWSALVNGYTLEQVTRALIFVQAVVVAKSRITDDVNIDIKTGKIATYLLNPIHYISYKFFESFPKSIYNLIISLAVGLWLWLLLLWSIPVSIWWIVWGIVLLVGGMLINFFWYFMIGLLGFYTEDADSFRLLYARMEMFFWGNILPLPFMPVFLQTIAFLSPFAYAGYTAWLIFTKFTVATFIHYAGMQILWIILLIGICYFIYNKAQKRLNINGG